MLRAIAFGLLAASLSCGGSGRPLRHGAGGPGLEEGSLGAAVVPILEPPMAVDATGTRVVVGAVRAEKTGGGWVVAEEAPSSWIVAAVPDGAGWLFVSWFGEVLTSATFTGPLRPVARIPAFVERQPSAGPLTVLGADQRLYVANGAGAMPVLEGLGEWGVVSAAFDRPDHGVALDLAGQLLETSDAGRTWVAVAAPLAAARETVARAARSVPAAGTPLAATAAAAALAAVLAHTGPLRGYGEGVVEALGGGQRALRLVDGSFVLLGPDGDAHPLSAPCPSTAREGPTLVSRCDDRTHVLDLARRTWVALAPGREPLISPSGRTVVSGSGCDGEDGVEVLDATTGAHRALSSSCIRLDGVTDTVGWGRADDAPGPLRLDLTTGRQERVALATAPDRTETFFDADGTLAAWPRDAGTGTTGAVEVTLLSPAGGSTLVSMPPATASFDLEGAIGLAAGEPETAAAQFLPALWTTEDRGESWRPVELPEGAVLQYPHCFDGACYAGNVRVAPRHVPAMGVRAGALPASLPPMPVLQCTSEPVAEGAPDTQVVETANASVELAVGVDEHVTVRWRMLDGGGGGGVAEGRIRGLIGDDSGAYRFLVSAVTKDTVFFAPVLAGRGPIPYMARRDRGLSPTPRGMPVLESWGIDLPDGSWIDVADDELRWVDRDGRARSPLAMQGAKASGWAIVDESPGLAEVVGLSAALPIYARLHHQSRRFVVREAAIRGCAPGARGARIAMSDSETRVPGANGTLMTELVVRDGTACIARLSNPGSPTDGVARLVALGPDRYEGVVMRDGAAFNVRCRP